MTGGLKNRGRSKQDIEERRKAVEEYSGTRLECISSYTFDPKLAEKNIENMIGAEVAKTRHHRERIADCRGVCVKIVKPLQFAQALDAMVRVKAPGAVVEY
jgi:hypothetical protein